MRVPFVDLAARQRALGASVAGAVAQVLNHGQYVMGAEVREFERRFASFCGSKRAIGVGNGTDALMLALIAAGVQVGDEVVMPVTTFAATAEAVIHAGGRPVFVEVDDETLLIDPSCLDGAISGRTRAVVPVHLYGCPAQLPRINEIAARHDLVVIEDAAQAHGALIDGRRAGSFGLAGCFSFYPSKNLGGVGDGGMVVTDDESVADMMDVLRNHGTRRKYEHDAVGFNSRLDTLQAAVLMEYLPHLGGWNQARRQHAASYGQLLGDLEELKLPADPRGEHVFHIYPIRVLTKARDELRGYLADREIETGVHYPYPLHLMRAYAPLGYRRGEFPVAEAASATLVSLPMYPELIPDQIAYVAGSIREFFRGA